MIGLILSGSMNDPLQLNGFYGPLGQQWTTVQDFFREPMKEIAASQFSAAYICLMV